MLSQTSFNPTAISYSTSQPTVFNHAQKLNQANAIGDATFIRFGGDDKKTETDDKKETKPNKNAHLKRTGNLIGIIGGAAALITGIALGATAILAWPIALAIAGVGTIAIGFGALFGRGKSKDAEKPVETEVKDNNPEPAQIEPPKTSQKKFDESVAQKITLKPVSDLQEKDMTRLRGLLSSKSAELSGSFDRLFEVDTENKKAYINSAGSKEKVLKIKQNIDVILNGRPKTSMEKRFDEVTITRIHHWQSLGIIFNQIEPESEAIKLFKETFNTQWLNNFEKQLQKIEPLLDKNNIYLSKVEKIRDKSKDKSSEPKQLFEFYKPLKQQIDALNKIIVQVDRALAEAQKEKMVTT